MSPDKAEKLLQDRDRFNRFVPKYRPDCIEIAKRVLENGGTTAMVAAECNVSKSAIQNWVKPTSKHFQVEFAEMWVIYHPKCEAFHDRINLREFVTPTKDFNAVLVSMFRRNNFDWTEHRKLDLPTLADPTLTFSQQRTELMKLVQGKQLTAHEFNYLTKALADFAQLEELEKLRIEIEELKALFKKTGVPSDKTDSDDSSGS